MFAYIDQLLAAIFLKKIKLTAICLKKKKNNTKYPFNWQSALQQSIYQQYLKCFCDF